MDPLEPQPSPSRSFPRLLILLVVAVLAAVAGYFLVKRAVPGGGSASATKPASDVLVPGATVTLTSKAAIVADRYNCLCGECSDTLGKCTCARDQGSNEMKATLNRLAVEKKSVPEIDAAMVQKYGPKVLASGAPDAAPASTSK